MKAVFEKSKAQGADRAVLLAIAWHADESFSCWPSRTLLCQESNTKERNLQYILNKLVELGELEIRRGLGRGNLTGYRILINQEKAQTPAPFEVVELADCAAGWVDEKAQEIAKKAQQVAPITEPEKVQDLVEKVQDSAEKVQKPVRKGAKSRRPYKEVEPKEPHMEPKEPQGAIAQNVQRVFSHWQTVHNHPLSKLDDKRRKLIRERFLDGYTVDELCQAIDGCKLSAWHQGQNNDGQVHDSIELILRDAGHIERFQKYLTRPAMVGKANGSTNGHHRSNGYDPAAVAADAIRKFEAIHGPGSAGPTPAPLPAPADFTDFVEGEILDDTF